MKRSKKCIILIIFVYGLSINASKANSISKVNSVTKSKISKIESSITASRTKVISNDLPSDSRNNSKKNEITKLSDGNKVNVWPSFDKLDERIFRLSVPTIANFAINPIIGAITLFWVGRLKDTLALAGMAAANQVYFTAFILCSYLPSITGALVSTEYAKKNEDGIQDAVCRSLFIGILFSLMINMFLFLKPEVVLKSVFGSSSENDTPAIEYAKPYLMIRSFGMIPAIINSISFAAFRGVSDPDTPLLISSITSILNILLHPIFMFQYKFGVSGAALAWLSSDVLSSIIFLYLLAKRKMISYDKMFQIPLLKNLMPLLKGGISLQIRNVSMNVIFIYVARVVQSIDKKGIAASAHSLTYQVFSVGGIVLLALSVVAQTLVPNEMVQRKDMITSKTIGGIQATKALVNRMMSWGFVLGSSLGLLQLLLLPIIYKITPIVEVQQAAKIPSYIACLAQVINGLVFIGEGVMIGCRNFVQLSISTFIATIATVISLSILPTYYGLSGVWMSFIVFNLFRLVGVFIHQMYTGPFRKTCNNNDMQETD